MIKYEILDGKGKRPAVNKEGLSIMQNQKISFTNSMNYKWICDESICKGVDYMLRDKTFLDNLSLAFKDPSEYFVSLRAYPFNVFKYFNGDEHREDSPTQVLVGGIPVSTASTKNVGYEMSKDNQSYREIYNNAMYCLGGFRLTTDEKFKAISYLDYSAQLTLHIPFCTDVELNPNEVLNHNIWVYLAVDYDTGKCTAYIQKEHTRKPPFGDSYEELIATADGVIGFDIPIGASNANENVKNFTLGTLTSTIAAIASIGIGTATGNVGLIGMGAAGGIAGVGKSTMSALNQKVSTIQQPNNSQAVNQSKALTLTITELVPSTVLPESLTKPTYASQKGLPLEETFYIKDLTGFTQVEAVNLIGFAKATAIELQEIENILRSGIIC